jgi:hypothetical protein
VEFLLHVVSSWGLGFEIVRGQDLDPGLPDQGLAAALGLDLPPRPQFEGGAGRGQPVEALLGLLLGQLAEVAGEVLAGGLDADDAAPRVEGEDVDDAEEVLPDAVRPAVGIPLLDDGADEALFAEGAKRSLGGKRPAFRL